MKKQVTSIVALFAMSTAASAITVSEQPFNAVTWQAFNSANNTVVEDFETLGAGLGAASGAEYIGGLLTGVGTFSRNGGTPGGGGTVTGAAFANSGEGVALRSGNVFGREDTTSTLQGKSGDWFFDSNDLSDIVWEINIGSIFDKLMFALTDPADTGASFAICMDGAASCDAYTLASQPHSSKRLVTIDFGGAVSGATILFQNSRSNDGFGLDDIAVSAVPLPAPALMLLAGLGAFGALRTRKKRSAV